ncbi:MAG: ribonuclease Z [Bacteroidales bacterium]|nr:ribonuclease Z [Bacteroidales bacterium]
MHWKLTVLGSSSALPSFDRMLSAQVLDINSSMLLFDCGEGTQFQLKRFGVRLSRIDYIFISHLHGDHFFGIFGLINTFIMLNRQKKLCIVSPPGLKSLIIDVLDMVNKEPVFPIEFIEIACQSKTLIVNAKDFKVYGFPLKHSIQTNGYLVEQFNRNHRIRPDFLQSNEVSFLWRKRIQEGEDFIASDGQVFKNTEITVESKVKRFAYASDTAYEEKMVTDIADADLLYHEATFGDDLAEEAFKKKHSTASQAAKIAKNAKAAKLLIGHFSSRYRDVDHLRKEAQTIFPETILAYDGLEIEF